MSENPNNESDQIEQPDPEIVGSSAAAKAPRRRGGQRADAGDSDREQYRRSLSSTVIAIPLLEEINKLAKDSRKLLKVIIDVNLFYTGGSGDNAPISSQDRARSRVEVMLRTVLGHTEKESVELSANQKRGIDRLKTSLSNQYIFADLYPKDILALVSLDQGGTVPDSSGSAPDKGGAPDTLIGGAATEAGAPVRCAIYRVWLDHEIRPLLNRSLRTVKADAAQIAFGCAGANIVWAVIDSGIDKTHPHFARYDNLGLPAPLEHQDFSMPGGTSETATTDDFGHGTHVAGIIAGELRELQIAAKMSTAAVNQLDSTSEASADTVTRDPAGFVPQIIAFSRKLDDSLAVTFAAERPARIAGMAPECKLLSLKALGANGSGNVSNIMAALAYIQQMNGGGRKLHVHGVNLSVGYEFNAEWFACGQSPLCVEVNRLVKSGVVVVVAAGNTGYGEIKAAERRSNAGMGLTINDPGNADLAITVGSTHREMPHLYGVSYFSSKGPTGDGRDKPDLVAPGEKILSCATGNPRKDISQQKEAAAAIQDIIADVARRFDITKEEALARLQPFPHYREESGTSMAAPHVSGVIAAFLSVRLEFVGQPEQVKAIFLQAAIDLKRQRHFQGFGLVDLMRAIQTV